MSVDGPRKSWNILIMNESQEELVQVIEGRTPVGGQAPVVKANLHTARGTRTVCRTRLLQGADQTTDTLNCLRLDLAVVQEKMNQDREQWRTKMHGFQSTSAQVTGSRTRQRWYGNREPGDVGSDARSAAPPSQENPAGLSEAPWITAPPHAIARLLPEATPEPGVHPSVDPSTHPLHHACNQGDLAAGKTAVAVGVAEDVKNGLSIDTLSEAELAEYLRQLFSIADQNGDGMLQPSEVELLLQLCGFELDDSTINQLVAAADLNNDGVIDYAEFVPLATKLLQKTDDPMTELLQKANVPIVEVPPAELDDELDEERQLEWRLMLPALEPPPAGFPVVCYIHGGAFESIEARNAALGGQIDPLLYSGIENGDFAVAVLTYRLTSEAGQWGPADEPLPVTWPAPYDDLVTQMKHFQDCAEEYQLDSSKFAVWGASSGGFLSAMLATRGTKDFSLPVKAAVDFYGPTFFSELMNDVGRHPAQLQAPWKTLLDGDVRSSIMEPATDGESCSKLMGFEVNPTTDASPCFQWGSIDAEVHSNPSHFEHYAEKYPAAMKSTREYDTSHLKTTALASANPCIHVHPETPPMFIAHGDNDPLVPTKQSARLYNALQHCNIESEFHVVPNGSHGFAFEKCGGKSPGNMPVEAAIAFVLRHF